MIRTPYTGRRSLGTHPHAVSGVGRNAEGGTRTHPRLNSGGVAPTAPGHLAHLDALAAAHLRLVDAHAELVRLAGRGAGA